MTRIAQHVTHWSNWRRTSQARARSHQHKRAAGVRRNPGDVLRLTAAPFVRLSPFLSLYAGADYWRKGIDVWSYVPGQPLLNPSLSNRSNAAGISTRRSSTSDGRRRSTIRLVQR